MRLQTYWGAAPDHLRAAERGYVAAAARPEILWPQGFSASAKKSASRSSKMQKASVLVPLQWWYCQSWSIIAADLSYIPKKSGARMSCRLDPDDVA